MRKTGVLPMQMLRRLLPKYIHGINANSLNPASIDLPLAEEAYRLETIFLPRPGERVRDLIKEVGGVRHDLKNHLEVGVPYLVRLAGSFRLPRMVYGYLNPKSSTGRINLLCRVVADGVEMYDALIPEGWKGETWVLAIAGSFPELLSPGNAVSQLRLFDDKSFLTPLELNLAVEEGGLIFRANGVCMHGKDLRRHDDSFLLTLRVRDDQTGFECRGVKRILDFSKIGQYRGRDFFTLPEVRGDGVVLRRGNFYILSTDERVMVPPGLSAELRAIDPRFGEFRSHAAGYIDLGWGFGKNGEKRGRPITLEVTPHEDMFVRHGQVVARIRYEWMQEVPEVIYDAARSNYTKQAGPKLSKHFGGW